MALLPRRIFEYLSCGELFGIKWLANPDLLSGGIPQAGLERTELSIN
jgi:hypothetical protein